MADGRRVAMRQHAVAQSVLVWGLQDIDIAEFFRTGYLAETTPATLVLDPELERRVAEEERRIQANNGKLIVNDGRTQ